MTPKSQPRRIRLPGFVKEEIGLGDVLQHATHAMGIRPCGGCAKRAQTFNEWIHFVR